MESSASSVDHTDERGHKQLESPENSEDRISALPDSLIHHILSFLPSTKQAIRTSILSKRWLNQWTRVPVLIFEIDREYAAFFLQFISSTLLLYDRFSKIKKFQISYDFERDINFASKLRFATRRDVEELILNCNHTYCYDPYLLPKFLFENASSLIKLQISNCLFQLSWKINWPSLKSLRMDGFTLRNGQSIPNVLSGSPSLESLEVYNVFCENSFVIASKSLKRLILTNLMIRQVVDIEISCPILEKLCVKVRELGEHSIITAKTLQHVLSTSPLLHSLVLKDCCYHHLVIASKSLKRLVLYDCRSFIISCPNLEVLNMCGTKIEACKLIFNTPSCLIPFGGPGINLSTKILEVLKPVKKLKVHNWIVKILPALEMGGQSYPWLNIKYWTLDCPNFKHISGILNVLRCSPVLERLVINLHPYKYRKIAGPKLNHFKETYQIANGTEFPCLVSHLKFVKIIGLSKKDGKRKAILYFVKFLLKNARALEKIVVMLKDGGMNKVSQNVLSFPSCSQNVIIEVL